jgi:hypothetical protein
MNPPQLVRIIGDDGLIGACICYAHYSIRRYGMPSEM